VRVRFEGSECRSLSASARLASVGAAGASRKRTRHWRRVAVWEERQSKSIRGSPKADRLLQLFCGHVGHRTDCPGIAILNFPVETWALGSASWHRLRKCALDRH